MKRVHWLVCAPIGLLSGKQDSGRSKHGPRHKCGGSVAAVLMTGQLGEWKFAWRLITAGSYYHPWGQRDKRRSWDAKAGTSKSSSPVETPHGFGEEGLLVAAGTVKKTRECKE